jgi:hypothetical protein
LSAALAPTLGDVLVADMMFLLAMLQLLFIVWALGAAGLLCVGLACSERGSFDGTSRMGFVAICVAWPLAFLLLLFWGRSAE